jgi:hypothetical protein
LKQRCGTQGLLTVGRKTQHFQMLILVHFYEVADTQSVSKVPGEESLGRDTARENI